MRRNFDDFAHDGILLPAQTITGDGEEHNGTGVDMKRCRTGVILFTCGAIDLATDVSVMVQKSEDNSTWEDAISAAKTFDQDSASITVTQGVINMERYWRIQYTVTSGKGCLMGVAGIGWDSPCLLYTSPSPRDRS